MEWILVILYAFSLFYLFVFSAGQLHLTYIYRNRKQRSATTTTDFEPTVTIQLPIYNEKYVVERLIDAISVIDYPREKLEIQILDDSTDETSGIIYQKLEWLGKLGLDTKIIHREKRTGYKAGALEEALDSAKGEFIAIFDSDFVPDSDFLRKTLPHFSAPDIGVVQTRWGHINKDYSFITELQAFGLDAHFSIEQSARNAAGSFINFNGTCGVWRKSCISDAGGWSADTLTEDLDLSYRAQLKGWKFKYLEEVVTPGELPVVMPVIKSQQYRWNKGAAETARKLAGKMLKSDLSMTQKIHGFLHLCNSSVFVAIFIAAITSLPLLYLKQTHPQIQFLFNIGVIFLLGFLSVAVFYWTAAQRFYPQARHRFFLLFPAFLIISMGLSLHNSLAVVQGWLGIRSPFMRTPKFNIQGKQDPWLENTYLSTKLDLITILEGILCICFVFGVLKGVEMSDSTLVVFHTMLALGFGSVFLLSLKPWANA